MVGEMTAALRVCERGRREPGMSRTRCFQYVGGVSAAALLTSDLELIVILIAVRRRLGTHQPCSPHVHTLLGAVLL